MATLKVAIDAREAERGANTANQAFNKVKGGAAGVDTAMTKNQRSIAGTSNALGGLIRLAGPLAAFFSATAILNQLNAYQNLENRIRLVTDSTEELGAVERRLFEVAQANRASLESTVELYSRVARNADKLGLSQQDVIELTDTVSQALVVSGTSAESASAALQQFGQALASGRLGGDELRSILENAPRLAQAVADGMGIEVGRLRQLGAEGKLTAEAVVAAIRSQSGVLKEEFGKTVPTISQGWQTIKNSTLQAIGDINAATGAGGTLAQGLINISTFITEDLTPAIIGFADTWSVALQGIGDFSGGAAEFLELFGAQSDEVFTSISNSIKVLPLTIVNAIRTAFIEVAAFFERIETRVALVGNKIQGAFLQITGNDAKIAANLALRKELEQELAGEEAAIAAERIDRGKRQIEQESQIAALAAKHAEERRKQRELDLTAKPKNSGGARDPTSEELEAAKRAAKELETFAKGISEQVRTPTEQFTLTVHKLDQVLAKGLITQTEYNRAVMEAGNVMRQADQALADADPVRKQANADLAEAEELTRALRTPQEQLNDEIQRYIQLLQMGAINEDTYARAAMAATEQYTAAVEKKKTDNAFLEEINKQAARNIFDAFSAFLFNPLEAGFDGMLQSFVNTLHKMATEALTAELFKILAQQFSSMGAAAGGSGSFWGTVLSFAGSMFGGGKAAGGTTEPGKVHLVGEKGPELVSFDRAGKVTPNDQLAGMVAPPQAPQVNVPVQVVNVQDPNEIPASLQSAQGQQAIINVLQRNKSAIRSILQGG